MNKRSSSDDYEPRYRRGNGRHRRSRRYADSTDDSYYDREPRRPSRRYHTDSRDYRTGRSSSRGSVRVVIANQIGDRRIPVREMTRSSSIEPVRVVHREEVIDMPERRRLSRSRPISFSRESYIEDGGRYIEDLERRTYCSAPRRLSRTRYADELQVPRYSSRPRSNSHVTFVNDVEEPVVVPRPRRLSRRRSMRFDGAADTEISKDEARDRSRSTRRPVHSDGVADTETSKYETRGYSRSTNPLSRRRFTSGGVQLIERPIIPHSRSTSRAIEPDRGAKYIEETSIEPRTPYYESDHDARSRSRSRSVRRPEVLIETPRLASCHRAYSETTIVRSREASRDRNFNDLDIPQCEPRRRYRETDATSDTEDERTYASLSYHHVRAPSPPLSDYLAGTLAKAQITPPRDQESLRDFHFAHGRAQRRYDDTPPPSAEYHRPTFYRDDSVNGAERGPDGYEYEAQGYYDEGGYPGMEAEPQGGGYDWMG